MRISVYTQDPLQHLVKNLSALPGIGDKTATRLALFIINGPKHYAHELARSIIEARDSIRLCRTCFTYTQSDQCELCRSPNRDAGVVCIVETPGDLMSIEKSGVFKGTYHVLHGVIAPLDGVGPDQLRVKELVERLRQGRINEVIIATNPTMNGNATAVFIADQLKSLSPAIRITRIAQGIPAGGDIGYTDQMTLKNALEGRRIME